MKREGSTMSKPEGSVLDCLFEAEGVKLNNIKFYRGEATVIDENRFRDEFCASVERKKAPHAIVLATAPKCEKGPLDLRALIAEM